MTMDTNEQKMKAALEIIARTKEDKLSRGEGLSRAEFEAGTAALRREAQQLENAPILNTRQALANGKAIAVLLKKADERDQRLASGLLDNEHQAMDTVRQRNKDLAEFRKVQAVADTMRQEQEAIEAALQKASDNAFNLGVVGLTAEEKMAAIRQFYADGSNIVRNEHGKHYYFNGGLGKLPIRATISEGRLMFAPGENVSGGETNGGE